MFAYLIRRVLYAIPILIGVNLITFALFFMVNTPDDMARMQLGVKRVTPEAIEKWKVERGYDKPLFVNSAAQGAGVITETIFGWSGMGRLFITSLAGSEIDPVMAYVMITGALAMVANLVADFVYGLLDPRIRVNA